MPFALYSAREGYSGVYSRISGAKEWIDQQVCELSDFKSCKGDTVTNSAPVSAPVSQTVSTMDEARADCTDSETGSFHIDSSHGMQGCAWLKREISEYGDLCKFVDVATTCPRGLEKRAQTLTYFNVC